MKTIRIPKRKLLFAALAVVAIIGVALVVVDIEASSGGGETDTAVNDPLSSAGITLTEAEVEAATAAAGQALSEIMSLDHTEGQEAWEARIESLCTENGLAFWVGPLFADQVWPVVAEQAYTTRAVEVVEAKVLGESESSGSVVVEVTLNLTYMLGEDEESIQEQKTNQVVMVQQDGQWLTDGPPAPSYWSSEE